VQANNGNVDIVPSTLLGASGESNGCAAVSSLAVKVLNAHQRIPTDIMAGIKLARAHGQDEEEDAVSRVKVDRAAKENEVEEEAEEEEAEVRTRKRKVRKQHVAAVTSKARALQPVDDNVLQGKGRRRLKQGA
jgi:hypothetical protein